MSKSKKVPKKIIPKKEPQSVESFEESLVLEEVPKPKIFDGRVYSEVREFDVDAKHTAFEYSFLDGTATREIRRKV